MKKRHIIMAALMVVMLFAVGCSKGESAEQAMTSAITAVKEADRATVSKYFDYATLIENGDNEADVDVDAEKMVKLVFAKLDHKIISATENGDKATVEVEITNTDMGVVINDLFRSLFAVAFSGISEEEMEVRAIEILAELMAREDNPTVTKTVTVELEKQEDSWKINLSDALSDALLGGMYSAVNNMLGTASSDNTPAEKLPEIESWLTVDIWNAGFYDISYYVSSGTDDSLDIEFTLTMLDKAMESKPAYDAYITALDETKYADVKMIWGKLSSEIDTLYGQIKTTPPVANDSATNIATGKFSQYHGAFREAIEAVE